MAYSSEATHSAFGAESTFGTCLTPLATASYSAVTGWYSLLHFVQWVLAFGEDSKLDLDCPSIKSSLHFIWELCWTMATE